VQGGSRGPIPNKDEMSCTWSTSSSGRDGAAKLCEQLAGVWGGTIPIGFR
jgi:hypothetical protein